MPLPQQTLAVPPPTSETRRAPIVGLQIGWVASVQDGVPWVDFDGSSQGPQPAGIAVPLDAEALRSAVVSRQRAALLFEGGDPLRPVLVGLMQEPCATPQLDALLDADPGPKPWVVERDGQRVTVEGKEELILRCGKASITLRRNGRVVLRGVHLELHSEGVTRIKGGSVQVN